MLKIGEFFPLLYQIKWWKNYLKNESYLIEASKPKSKSTKKSYLLLIKKTKNNNDNVWGCWHYESPKKKFYKKIEEPCEYRNYKEALFLAIENKSTFKSAIYTCTYTYNYDKVRASYIYARKKNF